MTFVAWKSNHLVFEDQICFGMEKIKVLTFYAVLDKM